MTGPIQQKATVIRGMPPVNWQPYLHSEVIDENDYDFITVFQKTRSIDQREKLLDEYKVTDIAYFYWSPYNKSSDNSSI